ncbi:MAG: winged helix-turn-helix domain-containing protein [Aquabacterium sp.]|nr:winged helix-turn-helix domain-containing protein [Aquabacterium sp.]
MSAVNAIPIPTTADSGAADQVNVSLKGTVRFADCELHLPTREFWRNGQRQPVRKRVFDLMAYLMACRPGAAAHADIARAVWGRLDVRSTVIAQAVLQARRATGDHLEQPAYFVSVHGVGYRFAAALKTGVCDAPVDEPADTAIAAVRDAVEEAQSAVDRDDYDAALFLSDRAIALADRAGANALKARALTVAARAALFKGTMDAAARYAYQALRLAEAEDHKAAAASARLRIAQVLHAGGDMYGALQMLDAVRVPPDAPDADHLKLRVAYLACDICGDLKQFEQAQVWLKQALLLAPTVQPERRAIAERIGAINQLLKEAEDAQTQAGRQQRAHHCCEQALLQSQQMAADVNEIGDVMDRMCWLGNQALALVGLGRLQEAWPYAEQVRRLLEEWPAKGSPWYLTHQDEVRLLWARMLHKAGRTPEALEQIERGTASAAAAGRHDQALRFATLAAEAHEAAGCFEAALQWLRRANAAQQQQQQERAALMAIAHQASRDNETLGQDLQATRAKLVSTQAQVQQLTEKLQALERLVSAPAEGLTSDDRFISALRQRHDSAAARDLPCLVGLVKMLPVAGAGTVAGTLALPSALRRAAAVVREHVGEPRLPVAAWGDSAVVFPLDGMGERRARSVCTDLQQQLQALVGAAAPTTTATSAAATCTVQVAPFSMANPGGFEADLTALRAAALCT